MSVDSLLKKQEKDTERLSALDKREWNLKSRLAGLKESLGNTLYKNEDASAWEVEIDGVQKDLTRCGAEKGKINTEMKKRIEEIRAAQETAISERLAGFKKNISGAAEKIARHVEPLEGLIKDMAENAVQLTYQNGIIDSAKLDGLYQFPGWLSTYLWQEINTIIATIIQGSRLPPQSNILPELSEPKAPKGKQ
jgi:predicted  nucleic acid-binding Zn-ribbon protein